MEYIISTTRLSLRKWLPEDRRPFYEMNSDPVVMEYFPKLLDEAESDAFADRIERHLKERGYGLWAVEEKETGNFVGYVGFQYTELQTDFSPCVEIGWRLDRRVWGRGYATEGARACLAYGFESLRFEEVYSFTAGTNARSERVMLKIGMRKLGEFHHPKLETDNPLCAHVLYRITREDYRAREAGAGGRTVP